MKMLLSEIAQLVGGELHGDGDIPIHGAAIIRDAAQGEITLADKRQLADELSNCRASAVVVPPDYAPHGMPFVSVADVQDSFAKIVSQFRPPRIRRATGVSNAAFVSKTASLGSGTVVYPHATIAEDVCIGEQCTIHAGVHLMEGVRIGDHVTIYPNAVLYDNTVVGNRVTLHAGVVLGAFGFGYRQTEQGHQLSAQLGYVQIEDDVEIGAGTTIDRGTYGPTTVGAGTKIDNLVMIGHNCRIGKHNLIVSQVGIAGSCTTGDYVVLAGQAGLRDHITIGSKATLGAKAGVMNDIPEGATYFGIPATPKREQFLQVAALAKLPQMLKEFRTLQREVAGLGGARSKDAA